MHGSLTPPRRFALPAPERCVARPCPSPRVVRVRVRPTPLVVVGEVALQRLGHPVEEQHLVEVAVFAALGAGPVVGQHDDHRVVEFAQFVDEVDDTTEMMIRLFDEPGEHLHLAGASVWRRRTAPSGHVGGMDSEQTRYSGIRPASQLALEHDPADLVPPCQSASVLSPTPARRDGANGRRRHVVEEEGLYGAWTSASLEGAPDRVICE